MNYNLFLLLMKMIKSLGMKKSNIQIIFVDIDWTIYSHKDGHIFDYESINALKRVQEKGIKVFLCTARPYHSVEQIGLLNLFSPDGMILCNGGLILYQGQIIHENRMDNELFEALAKQTISHNYNLEGIEPFHRFLITNNLDNVESVYQTFPEFLPNVEDYHNRHIISCLLFADEKNDDIIKKDFPQELLYYRFHPYGVDVLQVPHEKGDGVDIVLKYLSIPKENSMAFGDDVGDVSMFNSVNISVAMANGKDEAKNAATMITEEVWNSGVKNALIKLGLLEEDK